MQKHTLPVLQIRPNLLIKYYLTQWFSENGNNIENPYLHKKHDIKKESNKTSGTLSVNSIRKLKYAINLLLAISPKKRADYLDREGWYWFRLGFWTLTLPCLQRISIINEPCENGTGTIKKPCELRDISDDVIKSECLNYFLTDLRRLHGMRHYVWKAEAQVNGNIHFHITTNCWVHWQEIQRMWNKALQRVGLIDEYARNMKEWHKNGFRLRSDLLDHWSEEKQLKAYKFGHANNWQNPNSTDVHAVKNLRNMAAYMVKYMCKNEKNKRGINGKLWDCSRSLKVKEKCELMMDYATTAEWNVMKEKAGNDYRNDEYTEMIFTTPDTIREILPPTIKSKYEKFLQSIQATEPGKNKNR